MKFTQLKLVIITIFFCSAQSIIGQDLQKYFIQYYEEGNADRIREVLDLGFDPNSRIKGETILEYVINNSTDKSITVSVLGALADANMNLNNATVLNKIIERRDKVLIDFFISREVPLNLIAVTNQNNLPSEYLLYLKEKGFDINQNILARRTSELEKTNFIRHLKTGNKALIIDGLNTYMSNARMNHADLYYAIKTLDTVVINKVLSKCSPITLKTPYLQDWPTFVYGKKPSDFNKNDYPLSWVMATNDLSLVKYILDKGASLIESANPNSSPAIQLFVDLEYRKKWHTLFNKLYKNKASNRSSIKRYKVKKESLLNDLISNKILNDMKSSFKLVNRQLEQVFKGSFKFLMNGRTIEHIYVNTSSIQSSKLFKQYLNSEISFFENLFKRIDADEIIYNLAIRVVSK